jgi:hypothetical protein
LSPTDSFSAKTRKFAVPRLRMNYQDYQFFYGGGDSTGNLVKNNFQVPFGVGLGPWTRI